MGDQERFEVEGKPAARQGRKAQGPPSWDLAGLSNNSAGATMLRPYGEQRERMRPSTNDISHASLALHSSSLLYGRATGKCRK